MTPSNPARRARLLVVCGLPGTGKTTLAELLADQHVAVHLSVDSVEDALLASGLTSGWELGVAAYEAVRALAEQNLRAGRTVVVDAVNDGGPARDTWFRAAGAAGSDLHWIVLEASDRMEHRRRLDARRRDLAVLPEPSWADVEDRRSILEPWPDDALVLDPTMLSPEQLLQAVNLRIP